MTAYRWARDGVAVIVHPSNPVNQLSYDDLRAILTGGEISWGEFGGSRPARHSGDRASLRGA
jgi:phosphate transport system substrate-binding protein